MHCSERGREMASLKCLFLFALFLVVGVPLVDKANAAGECGKSTPDKEAFKLVPCMSAAQDVNAPVSNKCCLQVKTMGQNPSCLCAVLLSQTAKDAGVKPDIAVTIPKRCNIANRPVGYKCGAYTLP